MLIKLGNSKGMRLRKRFLTIVFSLFYWQAASALVLDDLYQASVPVADQSNYFRQLAITEALQQVLVKVSGNSAVASVDALRPRLEKAGGLVEQYSYVNESVQQADGEQKNNLYLKAKFDKKAVNKLLLDAGQAIWPEDRPALLVWFVVDENNERRLLGADNDDELLTLLTLKMQGRGVPVVYPLLDINDLQKITTMDVWAPFIKPVEQASQRYDSDGILLVRVAQIANKWETQWTLLLEGQRMAWHESAADLQTALQQGANDIADSLSQRFAVLDTSSATDLNELTLVISQIQNVKQYAKVMRYLQSLAAVKSLQVMQLEPKQVILSLSVVGGIPALQQAIHLGRELQQDNEVTDNTGENNILRYKLIS